MTNIKALHLYHLNWFWATTDYKEVPTYKTSNSHHTRQNWFNYGKPLINRKRLPSYCKEY